jgi:hypothetical protein
MRDLNSMADRIVVFFANPSRQFLPQRLDFTFMSLYRPHFPNNVESWKLFFDDERIYAFLQNEPLKKRKVYLWKTMNFLKD